MPGDGRLLEINMSKNRNLLCAGLITRAYSMYLSNSKSIHLFHVIRREIPLDASKLSLPPIICAPRFMHNTNPISLIEHQVTTALAPKVI